MTPSDIRAALQDKPEKYQGNATWWFDRHHEAIEQALRFTLAAMEVNYDNALNDASWEMHDQLIKHGEMTAGHFNYMKPCLHSTIMKWTTALFEQVRREV